MKRQWTRFPGKQHNRNISEGLRVTMGPDGVIYMNEAAWKSLGEPAAVEMSFDKPFQVIGLQKCEPTFESAFAVKPKSGSKAKIIHASAFCMHFMIKMMRTALFNEIIIDDTGDPNYPIMELHLKTVTAVTRGAR